MSKFVGGVDKPLCMELMRPYSILVTASDVIHSFALPDFNIKSDAIPGRIKEFYFVPPRLGIFTGYCRELCGAGHAHMPIVLEIIKGNGEISG